MAELSFNPGRSAKLLRMGAEQNAVLVIDDLFENPERLVAFATQAAPAFVRVTGDYYPGLRKPLPAGYGACLLEGLASQIRQAFAPLPDGAPVAHFCALSLATQAPDTLLPVQRIPHFDTSVSDQFAVVLYLCAPDQGGTSFYRHRATGFESVPEDRFSRYTRLLESESHSSGVPKAGYIDGDTALFERIGTIDARFNRAVIYRSNLLHSGNIRPARGLNADPARGRLTANAFIRFGT